MAKRVCIVSGCGTLIDAGRSRCDDHERERDKARGSSTARGYDAEHKRARAEWKPVVEAGHVLCRRCEKPIRADERWDLGHPDRDCPKPRAPEHERCNRATSGR